MDENYKLLKDVVGFHMLSEAISEAIVGMK